MQQDQDLKCLDDLIANLGPSNDGGRQSRGPRDRLLEHMQTARRDLLGSMPGEYGLSLQQARESVACISDKNTRTEVKKILQSLIDSGSPKNAS